MGKAIGINPFPTAHNQDHSPIDAQGTQRGDDGWDAPLGDDDPVDETQ